MLCRLSMLSLLHGRLLFSSERHAHRVADSLHIGRCLMPPAYWALPHASCKAQDCPRLQDSTCSCPGLHMHHDLYNLHMSKRPRCASTCLPNSRQQPSRCQMPATPPSLKR